MSTTVVQGFNSLRLLNLENNCIAAWDEIIKLSQLNSLEQLFLNNNDLCRVWYPDFGTLQNSDNGFEPFKSLRGLFLANNKIEDLESVDSLNAFPNLTVDGETRVKNRHTAAERGSNR